MAPAERRVAVVEATGDGGGRDDVDGADGADGDGGGGGGAGGGVDEPGRAPLGTLAPVASVARSVSLSVRAARVVVGWVPRWARVAAATAALAAFGAAVVFGAVGAGVVGLPDAPGDPGGAGAGGGGADRGRGGRAAGGGGGGVAASALDAAARRAGQPPVPRGRPFGVVRPAVVVAPGGPLEFAVAVGPPGERSRGRVRVAGAAVPGAGGGVSPAAFGLADTAANRSCLRAARADARRLARSLSGTRVGYVGPVPAGPDSAVAGDVRVAGRSYATLLVYLGLARPTDETAARRRAARAARVMETGVWSCPDYRVAAAAWGPLVGGAAGAGAGGGGGGATPTTTTPPPPPTPTGTTPVTPGTADPTTTATPTLSPGVATGDHP